MTNKYSEVSALAGTDQQGIVPAFSGWFTGTSRLRTVANTEQFSFNGYRYDQADSFWILPETPVNGNVEHTATTKGRTLRIGDGPTDKIVSQTRQRFVYSSGNSHQLTFAADSNLQEGRVIRYGYFDDQDGAFFEFKKTATGYLAWVVRRVAGVDERIPQKAETAGGPEWNIDSLDGISRSGELLDLDFIQMIGIDFTWYGAGEILLQFKMNRRMVPVHCFVAGNQIAGPILNNPNLPVRFEIFNDDGPTGVGDSTVTTYGIHLGIDGSDPADRVGFSRTFSNLVTSIHSGSTYVLGSLRPKLTFLGQPNHSWWQISDIQLKGSAQGKVKIVYVPTLNTPTWVDVNSATSFTEYDISSTLATGGVDFYTILFSSNKSGDKIIFPQFKDALTPASDGSETYHISFIFEADANGELEIAVNWNEKY